MAQSNTPPLRGYGLTLKEPILDDVLQGFKNNLLLNLNCIQIGKIQSFTAATKTASIQIVFKPVLTDGTTQNYPILINCPVFTLQGGGVSLQMPIAAGDTCIVLFCDRAIDTWFKNGSQQPPPDGRLHDMSDGIAIVGLNYSTDTTIPAPSSTEASLISGDGKARFSLNKTSKMFTMQNANASLLTALQTLITGIQGATAGGNPVVDATGNIATALTLLEALLYT